MNPSAQGSVTPKEEVVREVLNSAKSASGELSKEDLFFGPAALSKETGGDVINCQHRALNSPSPNIQTVSLRMDDEPI